MKRIFLALPVEDHIKEALEEVNSYFKQFNILKTVSPENYHITLKFLGETDKEKCRNIADCLKRFSPGTDGIPFSLKGLGTFPSGKDPSVIWSGIDTDIKAINLLQKKIEDFTEDFGYKKEDRKFVPHLTLARVKRNRVVPEKLLDYIKSKSDTFFSESSFTKIILYESILKPDGPEYREITSKKLNK